MFFKKHSLPPVSLLLHSLGAAGFHHLAMWLQPAAGWFLLAYLWCLWRLRLAGTARSAFYFGLLAGLAIMVPHTWFLLGLFNASAIMLWLFMSVWLGLMVSLWQACSTRWGEKIMLILGPTILLGVEYFRSEVWELKFAWLTAGFALPAMEWARAFHGIGVYGIGAAALFLVILATSKWRFAFLLMVPLLGWPSGLLRMPPSDDGNSASSLSVAGVQWEDASQAAIVKSLEAAGASHPGTQLFVTGEYSFPGTPTEQLLDFAKAHGHLLACGADVVPGSKFDQFYNTAFLVGPEGTVIHKQVKAVPIQFMDDGLPAPSQDVWSSPWGKIGFCICYDMNYAKVMDVLVRQGAQAVIIPAMDRETWGYHAHVLSARLGPIRAVEYGLPIFRLASSGISQIIQKDGSITAEGAFPGQGNVMAGKMRMPSSGHLPLDRWLVWPGMMVTGLLFLWFVVSNILGRVKRMVSK